MIIRKILILWLALTFFPVVVMAGWFGGSNDYDGCILESMKGVTSDIAANMIRNSCRQKFPKKEIDDAALPESAAQKIDGRAKESSTDYFKGTIFNGNNEWTVTSMVIRVTNEKTKAFRDYKAAMNEVAPMSTGMFIFKTFELPAQVDLSWSILNVYGHQSSKN